MRNLKTAGSKLDLPGHHPCHPNQHQAQTHDLWWADGVAEHEAPDNNANCREHGPGYSSW